MSNKIAFLFAGQGSQYVGMGKDLYDSFPEARAIFDKAGTVLGFDLKAKCFEGPDEMLKLTNISQPAILTSTIAAYEAFKTVNDVRPVFMAGLSLGEYSALVASGCLSFESGLRLVRKRSELMDDASKRRPGKMAAVLDLSHEKVKEICIKCGAEIANLNCPGQIVITGKKEAVEEAAKLCQDAGAKRVIELAVSGGFHSSLLFEASQDLKNFLGITPMSPPAIPVVSNYTAKPQYKVAEIAENLIYQMYSTVKWEESMRFLLSQGVTQFYEFGPGKILKGLMRKIEPSAEVKVIEKAQDITGVAV